MPASALRTFADAHSGFTVYLEEAGPLVTEGRAAAYVLHMPDASGRFAEYLLRKRTGLALAWPHDPHQEGAADIVRALNPGGRYAAALHGAPVTLAPSSRPRQPGAPDPLDVDTLDALHRFAADNGRTWKATLSHHWMTDGRDAPTGPLRTLRNTHGPAWLARFRLPA